MSSLPSLVLLMTLFRLSGVCLAVLLISACDKQPPTPPKAPTPAPPSVSAAAQPGPAAEPVKPEPAPVSEPLAKPTPKPAPASNAISQKLIDPNALEKHSANLDKANTKATSSKLATEEIKPVVRPPQPPDKIQRLQVSKPQTAEQRKASEAVKKQKLEKTKLDLRLPKDLVNKLEPQVADSQASDKTPAPALLPQMFADKPAQQSSFEMGGRIITNDHSRDQDKDASYWDTVDGAELQFKFNH